MDDDGVLDPLVVPDTLLVVPGFVKDDDGATACCTAAATASDDDGGDCVW